MNETIHRYKDRAREYWTTRSRHQQLFILGGLLLIIVLIGVIIFFSIRTNYAPLYNDLPVEETGQIKETLDSRGIPSEVTADGTAILVPRESVDQLKVELAAEGIPQSGSIGYEDFQDQLGFGMTENEFSVMEKATLETELSNLMQSVDGVSLAEVMITLPEETVWVSDQPEEASASIVLTLDGGYQLEQGNVQALYHLASRSIPHLPEENIMIADNQANQYHYEDQGAIDGTRQTYDQQREISRDIENDLQQQLQQMLGTMMGQHRVMVSVTTDIDFTQESREEELIEPVDEDSMEGIEISAESITETYEGEELPEEGVAGTGEDDIANYPGAAAGGDGDYERIEERVNNDVNRIHRHIQESPYRLRDLGIQVVVEPPDPEDMLSLPADTVEDIESILETVVSTSIDETYLEEIDDGEIRDKIFVSAQPFMNNMEEEEPESAGIPAWVYILGIAILAAIVAIIFIMRRNRYNIDEEDFEDERVNLEDIPEEDVSVEGEQRKRLERLAREKPEEFSKLLRTWLSED
ncbi:flagellar basal-body MS-ring/collar protein FliF [Natribacillus halophilus]|uniref:Flagellar M-ring protein n=1 Tax=Natribacillus halophilus TaxID=549003 RepID=A0A1G8PMJ2_9BACI|nr:flagellar basal-body MS-ring/collar protein FliF [Natribacillus halophilus]SDI93789.1 flagellar M-ring protein FliF [Natribacillus halophilus]